jgi:hypothetical protein
MKRGAVAAVVVVLGASATGAGAADRGVLRVVATRGPVTPVCAVDVPCDGPAAGVRISIQRQGAVVRRAVTDEHGRARLALLGGRYVVTATYGGGIKPRAVSSLARISAGRTTTVRFSFDTGIR